MSCIPLTDSRGFPLYNKEELHNLCGLLHSNIKFIERVYDVCIKINDNTLILSSSNSKHQAKVTRLLKKLHPFAKKPINIPVIQSLINHEDTKTKMTKPMQLSRKTIIPRNARQSDYLKGIEQFDLTFAVGPAGTGKTYLAVAKAIEQFEKGEVHRLVFVRPAVEAGEKLGFLPGDLVEKVLPYLRPIYDALYEMIGFKETQKLIQNDVIEILPLAFMRGRTLNEAFIILDEAQNTTPMQMKMFLTRIGFGSKAVVTGDLTQVDLPKHTPSGLTHALNVLHNIADIGMHHFTSQEVVRHPLVARIIDCYDAKEKKNGNEKHDS